MEKTFTEGAITRLVNVTFTSHVSEDLWQNALDEINECIEQIACDYAAASPNDHYEVQVESAQKEKL